MQLVTHVCLDCGNRFKAEVPDRAEMEEMLRQGKNMVPTRCRKCGSTRLQLDDY